MTLATVEQQGAGYINSRERTFEGWGIVDVLGHQRYVGYVTTEYFGQVAFFRVVTPARDQRERVVERDDWFQGIGNVPKGSRIIESGSASTERLIGTGSIYQLQPSTKDTVLLTLEQMDPREVMSATDPGGKPIEKPKREDDDLPW